MGEKGASGAPWMRWPSWRWRDVFLGLYEHTLDDKGRLKRSAKKYRAALDGCVVAKGRDVDPRLAATSSSAISSPVLVVIDEGRVRSFRRSLTSTATDQIDRPCQRISLPDRLRRYAGLDKDVVVTGADDHLELWSPRRGKHRGRRRRDLPRSDEEPRRAGFGVAAGGLGR